MADPRTVPPAPGTTPLVSERELRRYREDPALYAAHREAGTHPYTLGEIDARITACAADLAAAGGDGPVSPPVLRELIAVFWHRLYRDVPVDAARRAGFELGVRKTSTEVNLARENQQKAERQRRNLESESVRSRPPVTGTILTQPWTILLCLVPGAVVEVLGSTPSLKIAFEMPTLLAVVFAFAISAVLILAADQLGNALAGAAHRSRRLSAVFAGLLVGVAIGSAVWSVVELAHSREINLARQDQLEAIESGAADRGGFGDFGQVATPGSAAREQRERAQEAKARTAEATRRQAAIENLPSPSFAFFIPLSVMIMATATLVAFRIEAARDWNERATGLEDARHLAGEQRQREEEARQEANEAAVPEDEVVQELAAYVEREHGALSGWFDRFRAEYQRFCAVQRCQPRSIVAPVLPDPGDALHRLLHPRGGAQGGFEAGRRGRRGRPGDGPGPVSASPVGPDDRPPSATEDGEDPARQPRAAGTDGSEARPDPRQPRPRPRRSRRRDERGRAAGWSPPGPDGV